MRSPPKSLGADVYARSVLMRPPIPHAPGAIRWSAANLRTRLERRVSFDPFGRKFQAWPADKSWRSAISGASTGGACTRSSRRLTTMDRCRVSSSRKTRRPRPKRESLRCGASCAGPGVAARSAATTGFPPCSCSCGGSVRAHRYHQCACMTVDVWIPDNTRPEHRALLPPAGVVHEVPADGQLPERLGAGQFLVAGFSLERITDVIPRLDGLRVIQTLSAGVDRLVDKVPLGVTLCDPAGVLGTAALGPLVAAADPLPALRTGRIRAALAVTGPEPLPGGHPLWSAPGILITPHVGGWVRKRLDRSWRLVADQVGRFSRGEPLRNVVVDGY